MRMTCNSEYQLSRFSRIRSNIAQSKMAISLISWNEIVNLNQPPNNGPKEATIEISPMDQGEFVHAKGNYDSISDFFTIFFNLIDC